MIPANRLQTFNQDAPPGECVVYWMISARRSKWNHGTTCHRISKPATDATRGRRA